MQHSSVAGHARNSRPDAGLSFSQLTSKAAGAVWVQMNGRRGTRRSSGTSNRKCQWYAEKDDRQRAQFEADVKLEVGIAKHCLGSKIVDIHVCNFNNEICFTTKVHLQVASAPCMMHPTTHRHHRNTPATAYELRSLNCNSVTDLASLAKGTAILTHRID